MATVGAILLLDAQLRALAETANGLSAAIDFVAVVAAVVEAVTGHCAVDAMAATAPELVR